MIIWRLPSTDNNILLSHDFPSHASSVLLLLLLHPSWLNPGECSFLYQLTGVFIKFYCHNTDAYWQFCVFIYSLLTEQGTHRWNRFCFLVLVQSGTVQPSTATKTVEIPSSPPSGPHPSRYYSSSTAKPVWIYNMSLSSTPCTSYYGFIYNAFFKNITVP